MLIIELELAHLQYSSDGVPYFLETAIRNPRQVIQSIYSFARESPVEGGECFSDIRRCCVLRNMP